jgi:hypothetical protein
VDLSIRSPVAGLLEVESVGLVEAHTAHSDCGASPGATSLSSSSMRRRRSESEDLFFRRRRVQSSKRSVATIPNVNGGGARLENVGMAS